MSAAYTVKPVSRTLAYALLDAAARHAEHLCLVFYDADDARESWTFAAFMRQARQLATWLEARGVAPGDRVATVSNNRPEVLLAYVACWLSGAVACPVNVEESSERKAYILTHGACKVALVEAEFKNEVARCVPDTHPVETLRAALADLEPLNPADLPLETGAFLVYTSGTTGEPKGVLLTHGNLLANARATAEWHTLQPGDSVMTVLPIHHVNGAVVTGLTPLLAGARNVLNRQFSPRTFWRRLARERAALASVVPTLLEFLLAADEDVSGLDLSLRYLLCGAGPLLGETVTRFEERFGVPVCHGFGMSETTAYNTQFPMNLPSGERRYWYTAFGYPSVGCTLSCNEVAVLRADGSEAAPLERGQLAVRGPAVMTGYLGDPEATATAFKDGWFLSGDEGFFEADRTARKFFFVSGRIKETIVRGGVNVSPLEIDAVLKRLPGVRFALSFPFENLYYGEEIAAYLVLEDGVLQNRTPQDGPTSDEVALDEVTLDEAAVLEHVKKHLPFAKTPKVILFGANIPFTTTGKPKRLALAAALAADLARYRGVQFKA